MATHEIRLNVRRLSWERFAALMEKEGRRRPLPG